MTNKNDFSVDGVRSDGVGHTLATPKQLAQFDEASRTLSRFRTPILVHADNPHEKLFVAAFDGTGNHKYDNPAGATNVAKISDQLEAANPDRTGQVHVRYMVGPGTQNNKLAASLDGMLGHTYERNLETMYGDLVRQANAWKKADPDAVIRLQTIGFSRGASQAAGFTRLVHERGIPDLSSRSFNAEGRMVYGRYHVAPTEIVQTVGLFDPVATGMPMQFDRRLPPSVVSGLQITAADELRAAFPSDQIIPPGLSKDGRFLNVVVPGAHSDIGGAYQRNGLSIRSGNLMIDYCNSARDVPFLEKRYEPQDPRLNVIHRSTEGKLVYRLDPREAVRGEPSGTNFRLAPGSAGAGPLPHHPEAANAKTMTTVTYRNVQIGRVPDVPERPLPPPVSAAAMEQAGRSVPLTPKLAGAAVGAAMVYDTVKTVHRTSELLGQENIPGSQSELMHFSGHTLGGIAGGLAGARAGGALGAMGGGVLGPEGALVVGALGAVGGAWVGGKMADAIDHRKITHQDDPQGHTWRYESKDGWVRDIPPLPGVGHGQRLIADTGLAARLTYQANSTSAELALARAGSPADPYTQPASPRDTASVKEAPWVRSDAGVWSRHVSDQILEHGLTRSHNETASPTRTAELNQAARQTSADNFTYSPRGIAQRYEAAYVQQGWQQHGPMPEAVTLALQAPNNQLMASDGHSYTRDAHGTWSRPGVLYGTHVAEGNLRDELNAAQAISADAPTATAHQAEAAGVKQTPATPPAQLVHDGRLPAAPSRVAEAGGQQPARQANAPLMSSSAAPGPSTVDAHPARLASSQSQEGKAPVRLDHPDHPDYSFYCRTRTLVHELDRLNGRTPDQRSDQLASAATVSARASGLQRIDKIALSDDANALWAVQRPPGMRDAFFDQHCKVPTVQGMNTSMEHTGAQWPQAMQQFHQHQEQTQQRQQQMQQQGQGQATQSSDKVRQMH